MESTSEYQKRVNEGIEQRRQHMIERANYTNQFLLSASFNLTDHRPSTNDSSMNQIHETTSLKKNYFQSTTVHQTTMIMFHNIPIFNPLT
ncbi:unnamed protein product [Adineta ricciae]|uniref:Uncharacterized protein n=1 Tax=Adineta ricciae TaxID=249248 RepID=A0A815MK66_ADIRI|nr:unnamed protein product [Adineta ricciae]